MYEDFVKDGLTRGVFKRVSIPGLPAEAQIYVVYNKTRPLSASAAAFLNVIQKHCRDSSPTPYFDTYGQRLIISDRRPGRHGDVAQAIHPNEFVNGSITSNAASCLPYVTL